MTNGPFDLLCDAAPDREWALGLTERPGDPPMSPHNRYWWRIISVLCSRLYMAEVRKLPGYNHDATEGPFGVAPKAQPTLP